MQSPSARKVWIEIQSPKVSLMIYPVTFREEGVDWNLCFNRKSSCLLYTSASVAAEFKLIENETKTIVIGKEPEAEKIIQRLRFGEHSRELMRDVGQYSVQIYKDAYEKLRAAGYLEAVEGFDNELAILKGKELYKEEYGLQMDVGFGDAIFG